MRTMIASVAVSILLGGFTVGAAQLPPDIMVDRYLLQAEQLMEEKDHKAALETMDKITALQKEHDLTLPDGFHFKYAQVAFSAGLIKTAMESVNQYLMAAGREGEFYREALELLDEVEPIQTLFDKYPDQIDRLMAEKEYEAAVDLMDKILALQREHDLALPEEFYFKYTQVARLTQPCTGQPKGAGCWLVLSNQPECYVWDDDPQPDTTVTWTGECAGGLAQGTGTLTWVWDSGTKAQEATGLLQNGKRHSTWVVRDVYGTVEEGPYVEGKRHGTWVETRRNRKRTYVEEGSYVNGKKHGDRVEYD